MMYYSDDDCDSNDDDDDDDDNDYCDYDWNDFACQAKFGASKWSLISFVPHFMTCFQYQITK